MSSNDIRHAATSDLFTDSDPLPDHAEYPSNIGTQRSESLIHQDIRESRRYLIITGYSSLEYLIKTFGNALDAEETVEIVLGNEPLAPQQPRRMSYPGGEGDTLPLEIRRFWLERGISILLNREVLTLIEKIRYDKIRFFYRPNTHAKIYKGDTHVMLGSSNFSGPGMRHQDEANVRRAWGMEGFTEIEALAEYYRNRATPWNTEFIELLEQLLRGVSWQEALARAVALIKEGQWIGQYPQGWSGFAAPKLWPTQKKAIAQALYILERQGSVLVADPTGSGKTRLGTHLLEGLLNKLWQQSAQYRARYQIICPPQVADGWQRELDQLGSTSSIPISQGMLSQSRGDNENALQAFDQLKKANILLIDEAHNYLNKSSGRSQSIVVNRADHIILFTATPLNRRSEDLLRLVEILGLDNLSDAAYKTYKRLMNSRDARTPENIERLREYVHRFMVRRTKKELNEAISAEPEAYRDLSGNRCRYPVHLPRTYATAETSEDKKLALKIEQEMSKLKGIIYVHKLHADSFERSTPERQQTFLKKRIKMGPALMRYNIRNRLRSSRAALVEHLSGTEQAMKAFGITHFKQKSSGNILNTIEELRNSLPKTNLDIPLPQWMRDKEAWQMACDQERATLGAIGQLARRISDSRERGKAQQIARLIDEKGMLLAYDTSLITLQLIKQYLKEAGYGKQAMVVTGSTSTNKKKLKKKFALQADAGRMAALCTDAMSEGINLQRAAAVIFLDMPSVIRIAEQRIGRIDRMDSPHKQVEVYWPDDSPEFQMKTDRKFYHRHQMVEDLIGSNISLPEHLIDREEARFEQDRLSVKQAISDFQQHQQEDAAWEGFEDAFSALNHLISGQNPLLEQQMYDEVAKQPPDTGPWISVVKTRRRFVFAAIKGSENNAPYWIFQYQDQKHATVIQEMNRIIEALRQQLPEAGEREFDTTAEGIMKQHIDWLQEHELDMLPHKKQNAIRQMKAVLPAWLKRAKADAAQLQKTVFTAEDAPEPSEKHGSPESYPPRYAYSKGWHKKVHQLNELMEQHKSSGADAGVDWYELANRWLDVAQPRLIHWLEKERKKRKYQDIRLRNIDKYLENKPMSEDELDHLLRDLPALESVEKRIVSMIIGI
ncbi:MAG: SNF2-related protein [Cyclonatronaceae bacterium]